MNTKRNVEPTSNRIQWIWPQKASCKVERRNTLRVCLFSAAESITCAVGVSLITLIRAQLVNAASIRSYE
jgi:hypothetical protein